MDRQFLISPTFDKQSIISNVLGPNNFDGQRAHADLRALAREEEARVFSRQLVWFGFSGTLFSLFNLTRMGVLSPSGKTAALGGVAFFGFLTYAAASRAGYFNCAPAAGSVVAEEKKAE